MDLNSRELTVCIVEDLFKELNCTPMLNYIIGDVLHFEIIIGVKATILISLDKSKHKKTNVRVDLHKQTLMINSSNEIFKLCDPDLYPKLKSSLFDHI